MKTPEELKALKEEVETLNKKLAELSEEELRQVSGGEDNGMFVGRVCPYCGESADFKKVSETYKFEYWHCVKCGDMTYLRYENRWERGFI